MSDLFKTRVVSVTPEAEKTILYCARVSSDQENTSTGLIRYLIRNKHWSPFELAHMTIEIETSRAISHQILRHRSFSFQEFSQRYSSPSAIKIYPARLQAESNRQSSTDDVDEETAKWWDLAQEGLYRHALSTYEEALRRGIARECARFVLPEATATKLYMSGSLRSWIHYLDLRMDPHTQLEHQQLAFDIANHFIVEFPIVYAALSEEWEEAHARSVAP